MAKKYYYRVKDAQGLKNFRKQRIGSLVIGKEWTKSSKKLDIEKYGDNIEEKIENSSPKQDLYEEALKKGFPEVELKGKTTSQLKQLLSLDEEKNG